jgi:hypothetical protein
MINGLHTFGIGNGNGISLLTDGGLAFKACADIYNFQHILCTYHFTLNVFATTSKMSNDMKHWYLQICGDLVFHPFDDETTWYSKSNELHEKLVEFPNAMSYITKMYEKRKKVCATFTKWRFTADCKSTQRSESVNSLVKQNGRKRASLKTMEIDELMIHMDSLVVL